MGVQRLTQLADFTIQLVIQRVTTMDTLPVAIELFHSHTLHRPLGRSSQLRINTPFHFQQALQILAWEPIQ